MQPLVAFRGFAVTERTDRIAVSATESNPVSNVLIDEN